MNSTNIWKTSNVVSWCIHSVFSYVYIWRLNKYGNIKRVIAMNYNLLTKWMLTYGDLFMLKILEVFLSSFFSIFQFLFSNCPQYFGLSPLWQSEIYCSNQFVDSLLKVLEIFKDCIYLFDFVFINSFKNKNCELFLRHFSYL